MKKKSYIQVIRQLDKFVSAFSNISSIDLMVQSVEKILDETFSFKHSGLYLYDSSEDRLKLIYSKGLIKTEFIEAEKTAMVRYPGQVYRSGEMMYIPDILVDNSSPSRSEVRRFSVRSRLCLAVRCGDQVVGAFETEDSKPNSYNEEDIAILTFICNMTGSIYANILNKNELNKIYQTVGHNPAVTYNTDASGIIEFVNPKAFPCRKEDFQAFQVANLRFKSLISSIPAGIMVMDEQNKVVLVNQYFCDLFAFYFRPEQLIGMNCTAASEAIKMCFNDPESFIRDINTTLINRQVVTNHELHMISGKSLERDFIPIENSEFKNQGILWIYRNITERKKTEKDLLRQSDIINGTAKAMNFLLTITNHDQAIQKALEAAAIATGVDRAYIFECNTDPVKSETFLSQRYEWTAEGVIPQMDNTELQNLPLSKGFPRWYELFSNGRTLSGLVRDFPEYERQLLERLDIISLIVVPVFVNDYFWGTVGFDDCSKGIQWSDNELSILTALAAGIGGSISREIIGKELSDARKIAENATKTESDFLATMSHEIRTPMNGVIGMTSLLLQTQLNPDQRDYTETIKISGELLLDLINDILDFSKIESGKMILEMHSFDLRLAIEDVLDLIATTNSQKNIELYFQVDPVIPQRITGDLTHLRQILVNLVGNAIKFTSAGEVVISVKQSECKENEVTLEFSVKDSGVGIPAEKIDRLFKPFSQVDASTTRKYGGTGLGLAICYRLVKMMNGNIRVQSVLNQGSEFLFTIKTSYQPYNENPKFSSPSIEVLKGKQMMIVNNNSTGSAILNALFRNLGMTTFIANSAKSALSILNNQQDIDVALIDNDISDMDCLLLATEIKKTEKYADLPLILITFPTLTGNQSSIKNNFHVRIKKPIKQSQLISSVIKLQVDGKNAQIQNITEPNQLQKINEIYPLSILVAEDNTINQKLILRLFEMLGYTINIAANGFEVIEALNRMKTDIVFMDIQMPEMDGIEATREIVSIWGDKRPLIVAMTANALRTDKEKCLAAGMDDYISKPLTIDQVKMGIEKWATMLKVTNNSDS